MSIQQREPRMKIVVAGEVDLPAESRDTALAGARKWIEAALAEHGCRHYAWTADPHDPRRIHVFEEWDCAEDLAAHLRGPAYLGMLGHLSSFSILAADTRKYRVDLVEPVYGADGVASATFVTAR
jgi:quinol monooxygenase YgiN